MKITMYQIDAFASHIFKGNPAAVCPLETWLADDILQAIAAENNLSETAFFVAVGEGFAIRWFTPTVEVRLCGHATLASAFVLFEELAYKHDTITFYSLSGVLTVCRSGDDFILDFPVQSPVACEIPGPIRHVFGDDIVACLKAEDYTVVLATEDAVVSAQPDFNMLKFLDLRGVVITSESQKYDFVSRFFAPNCGIDEDPVTGSAFTQLAPYWAKELGLSKLIAKQVSKRGGLVRCQLSGDRVKISGKAVKYLEGSIYITNI